MTWFAVRCERADKTLSALSLSRTGALQDDPESAWSTVRLTSGWQLVWCNDYECPLLTRDRLALLSAGQDVLVCKIEEHCMASSAEFWSGGTVAWSLAHEGENGPAGLDVEGRPPPSLATIRRELEVAQEAEGGMEAGVDYIFDIPLRVAREIVGFKHDENYEGTIDGRFEVLQASVSKKGLLSRLFG